MVYRQDEWQAKPYQEKAIEQKGESQRKNEGKSLQVQWLLEWSEVPIALERSWMGIPKDTRIQ